MKFVHSMVLAVIACSGCSSELGPDHYAGAQTPSERNQKKSEYVNSLRTEDAPFAGWNSVMAAGRERAWGVAREGTTDLDTSQFEYESLMTALASCEITTVDILYAPADRELNQLSEIAATLISMVFAKRSSNTVDFEDSLSQEILSMRRTATQNGHLVTRFDRFEPPLRVPKLSITRKRERISTFRSLIDGIDEKYGLDVAAGGQLLLANFEVPVLAGNGPYTLRASLIYDAPNERWVFARFTMKPRRLASASTVSLESLESDIEASLSAERQSVEYLAIDYFPTPIAEPGPR